MAVGGPGARRRLRDDSGLTLVELLVAMVLLAICMSMVSVVLISTMKAQVLSEGRSQANDVARAAVRDIDRQVRSGNIIYAPDDSGYSLKVYTQANGNLRCVQWKVNDKQLRSRAWAPNNGQAPIDVQPWRTIVSGIFNGTDGDSTVPFALGPTGNGGSGFGNLVVVDLKVDAGRNSKPVEIATSVEGRNTVYNYPHDRCTPEPS
jgi:prepilin-type N-terminal cleavage/methylation domain-containing protein